MSGHWPPVDGPHRAEVQAFLRDIRAVCEAHGLCFGHEDPHGAFTIERYTPAGGDTLACAIDTTVEVPRG